MHGEHDDDGQDDGEHVGAVGWARFQPRVLSVGQPWLRQGVPPWHLWGSSQITQTQQTGGSGVASAPDTQQLAKIAYGRPESWHWVFMATLLEAPTPALPGSGIQVDLFFDLILGVGRSSIKIPAFEHFQWSCNNPNPAPVGEAFRLFTTSVRGNRLEDQQGIAHTTDPTVVEQITAQEIQLQTRFILTTTGSGFSAKAEVSAYFAPKTHVRPDWYQQAPDELKFPGGEVPAR